MAHFIPKERRQEDFPFTFEFEQVDEIPEQNSSTEITFVVGKNRPPITEVIRDHLVSIFDYYRYLNEYSEDYITTNPDKSPTYYITVKVNNEVREPQGYTKTGKRRADKVTLVPVNSLIVKAFNFKSDYSYSLVPSIEELKKLLTNVEVITYDVETSGLDAENDIIAGINFAISPNKGYYIPINHDKQFSKYNLGDEAIDVFYEAMKKAKKIYMFNSRFDIRFLEYLHATPDGLGNISNKKYSFKDLNVLDTQLMMHFADPDCREHSMKFGEEHFLGFYRPDLFDTLKAAKLDTFDTTKIDPRKLLFYAAQDGITTYQLGVKTEQYLNEFKLSGQIDKELTYALMDMENRLIRIDTEYVEKELAAIRKRLNEVNNLIVSSIGKEINLNSPQQKVKLFESFGLDTGERTKTGAMSTGREAVDNMIKTLDAQGKSYPDWLKYLGEQSKLQQLESTFFGALQQQMYYRDGRVRLNYRHGVTATGRLSSGKETF